MDADKARLWADALDSGKYTKVVGELVKRRRVGGELSYCASGVLCEVAREYGDVELELYESDSSYAISFVDYIDVKHNRRPYFASLPLSVMEWADTGRNAEFKITPELKEVFPPLARVVTRNVWVPVLVFNDSLNWSFKELAVLIRFLLDNGMEDHIR